MRFSTSLVILYVTSLTAAASWGFEDGSVGIHGKKAGAGGQKEK